MIFNLIYIVQSINVSMYETWHEFEWPEYAMCSVAILILMIELIQISFNPYEYLSQPFNYLDLTGNGLVLLTRFPYF